LVNQNSCALVFYWSADKGLLPVNNGYSPPISLQLRKNEDGKSELLLITINTYGNRDEAHPVQYKFPTGIIIQDKIWKKLKFSFKLGRNGDFKIWEENQMFLNITSIDDKDR
jgi:hypothetical protein